MTSMTLAEYLASIHKRRWRPGVLDCGIFMADWVVSLGHADPIADIRGRYRTVAEFDEIITREGGFISCAAARLEQSGLTEVQNPQAGDVLAVQAPYGKGAYRPAGAIAVDHERRAVVTWDKGLVIANSDVLPTLKVWRPNHA